MILAIVAERASKVQVKLDTVPKEFWPLLSGVKGARIAALIERVGATGIVTVYVPRAHTSRGLSATATEDEEEKEKAEQAIDIKGEREAVAKVVEAIEAEVVELVRPSLLAVQRLELTTSICRNVLPRRSS
jgi:hypothetical protein